MSKIVKKTCCCCGKDKAPTIGFYVSRSDLYANNDGRIPICKDCLSKRYIMYLDRYGDERKALYHICMNLDITYNEKLVDGAFRRLRNRTKKESLFTEYIIQFNSLNQYKGMTSFDSEHLIMDNVILCDVENKYEKETKEDDCDYDSMKIPSHVKKRWGSGYSNEEYIYLEDNYEEFYDAYSHETPAEKMLLMNITKSLLEAERSRKAGKTKEYENMMKLVSSMLTDANIKPSQKKNKGDEVGECFGTFIENIEKNEPIGDSIEEFADADGIGRLFERQFVKNFAKVFGLVGDDNEDED